MSAQKKKKVGLRPTNMLPPPASLLGASSVGWIRLQTFINKIKCALLIQVWEFPGLLNFVRTSLVYDTLLAPRICEVAPRVLEYLCLPALTSNTGA